MFVFVFFRGCVSFDNPYFSRAVSKQRRIVLSIVSIIQAHSVIYIYISTLQFLYLYLYTWYTCIFAFCSVGSVLRFSVFFLLRVDGLKGLFRGLPASLMGIVPYSGTDLAMFYTLRARWMAANPDAKVTVTSRYELVQYMRRLIVLVYSPRANYAS